MSKLLVALTTLATLALATPPAAAEGELTTTVYTASPNGFLVTSTLVAGERDAVLIDAQFTLADAHRLVALILESKKHLTTVYVTHDHPDHYFGLGVIKQAFPKAKLVALPATVAGIQKTWKAKVAAWRGMYGALVPERPVLPIALRGTTITLEGKPLEIRGPAQGDSAHNTFVWIPSIKTAIAGDIAFDGVHAWTAESTPATRKAWIATLDAIAALRPATVIAGHRDPAARAGAASLRATRAYLEAFDAAVAASATSAEVQRKVKARYGTLQLDIILELGANAAVAPAP